MQPDPAAMRWPGLRAKLRPLTIVRVPGWGLSVTGPTEYYGAWCCLHVGPWLLFFGSGTYDR